MSSKLWIFKSKGNETSFGGNNGYADVPTSYYLYDNTVKNYNKVQVNDNIIVVNKKYILGYAKITSIVLKSAVPKIRYRCPKCNTQEHSKRKNRQPKYRCRNKHEFDTAIEQNIVVDEFVANYASTFIPAEPGTKISELNSFYLNRNKYYSIQSADVSFLELVPALNSTVRAISTAPNNKFSNKDISPYVPSSQDDRERKFKLLNGRQGQNEFRNNLISVYGSYCMITGINVVNVIEASHICPYRGEKDNHILNGLLLRADLHKLFDSDLLGINPESLEVEIHPLIGETKYKKYQSQKLTMPNIDILPSIAALSIRWKIFRRKINC
jgi:putative restriction endonuclease